MLLFFALRLTAVAEDILHVRLQTIGVTEHAFDINLGGTNYNWMLYDVGGAVRVPPELCPSPRARLTTSFSPVHSAAR